MTSIRLTPERRRAVIVTAAMSLSKSSGICGWTRAQLADACDPPTSKETTKHYFKSLEDLRKTVVEHPECTDDIRAQARAVGLVDAD